MTNFNENNNLQNDNLNTNNTNTPPASDAPAGEPAPAQPVQPQPESAPAQPREETPVQPKAEQPSEPRSEYPRQPQSEYPQQPQNEYPRQPQSEYPQQPRQNPYAAPQYHAPAEHVYSSYNQAPVPEKPKKKKKAKKAGISAGAVAVLCVCSLLLSCASGFFGAYLATGMTPSAPGTENTPAAPSQDGNNPSVIYQAAPSPAEGMSSTGGTSTYYNVAATVKNSVVEITTEFRVDSYFQYITSGAGSGVIISADGYVITNNHVISNSSSNSGYADTITVRLTTGEEYTAELIGADADSDIAVIKIKAPAALPCAVMGSSDELGVGEEVIAVGNPLGELGGTVTNGIISALNREINVDGTTMNLLQTNTAINPGNSGGGLFNMDGELIGIVNAKSSGSDIEGLGFAIPINEAIHVAEELMTKGYVSGRPYLGVEFFNATSMSQALYYGLPSLGVYVSRLEEGLNDDVFKIADRVIAVDGKEIGDITDISTIVKSHKPGDTITFSVYRSGKLIEVKATCHEYVPEKGQLIEAEGSKQ